MNYGKWNGDVYERSVVKILKTEKTKKIYDGAEIGDFCAFPCGEATLAGAQAQRFGKDALARAYLAAAGALAAKGYLLPECSAGAYAMLSLFVPERLREMKVRGMLAEAAGHAKLCQIPIMSVSVQVLPWIELETAVCTIHTAQAPAASLAGAKPGEEIVMTKWLGLEGTAFLVKEKGAMTQLKARYPSDLIEEAADFGRYASVLAEAATAVKSGAGDLHPAGEGGIFGALWELAAKNRVGLVADLKNMPVRQETVEVCEYFDLNPYTLLSGGSLLITCADGAAMVRALAAEDIPAAVIGKITGGSDRIVRHGEESRFLEPARGDEIYSYYTKREVEK